MPRAKRRARSSAIGVTKKIPHRARSAAPSSGSASGSNRSAVGSATSSALIILWAVRRADRVRARTAAGVEADAAKPEDPAELELAAAVAEQAGDFERAVRLRFRAGLLRLGRRGAIEYRPSVTTAEVRRELESERFERLAGTFEHVAYGGRPATPPDADEARANWPHVLEESAPR